MKWKALLGKIFLLLEKEMWVEGSLFFLLDIIASTYNIRTVVAIL